MSVYNFGIEFNLVLPARGKSLTSLNSHLFTKARPNDNSGIPRDKGIIQHNFVPKLKKVHSTGSKYVANEFDRSPDILNNLTSGPLQHSESAKKLSSPAGLLNRDMSQKDTERQDKRGASSGHLFNKGKEFGTNYNNPAYASQNYGPRSVVKHDPYARRLDINEDKLDEANYLLNAYTGAGSDDPLVAFMQSMPARPKPKVSLNNQENYKPPVQPVQDDEDALETTRSSTYRTPKRALFTPYRNHDPTPQYQPPYQGAYPPNNMFGIPNYSMHPHQFYPSVRESMNENEPESEVRHSLERQNMVLENFAKNLESKVKQAKHQQKESKKYSSVDPDAVEHRLRKFERENELKQMILKQKEKLEALEKEKLEQRYERSHKKHGADIKDQLLKEQSRAIREIITGGYGGNPSMMNMGYQQYGMMSPYTMNPMAINGQYMMNPMYNQWYGNYGYQGYGNQRYGYQGYGKPDPRMMQQMKNKNDKKKDKRNKRKKNKRDEDDEDETDEDDESDESDETDEEDEDDDSTEQGSVKNAKGKKKNDKKNKQKDKGKAQKLRKKLGALLWAAVFPKLFVKDQHKAMANVKNDTLQKFDRAIADGYNKIFKWLKAGMAAIIKSFDEQNPEKLDDLSSKQPNKQKIAKDKCLQVLTQLIQITTEDSIGRETLLFLGNLAMDGVYIPSGTLSPFELNRLNFSKRLLRLTLTPPQGEAQSKMILTCIVFFRMVIYNLLLKPWDAFPEFSNRSQVIKDNLMVISSILYQLGIAYFHQEVPVVSMQNYMVQGLEPLAPLFANQDDVKQGQQPLAELEEVINNLMPFEKLENFITDENMAKDIQFQIIEWSHQIYALVAQVWVATNHALEELKQKKGDPEAEGNLKVIKENPLLSTLVQRNMLHRQNKLTGTANNGQNAFIRPTDAQYQATKSIIS